MRQNIAFFYYFLNFALGRNRTRDPRVPEPKRTPLGYIIINYYHNFYVDRS
jgi:hypothetical protein